MKFSVSGGLLEPEHGNMIEIDSYRWFDWLAENQSFRYESDKHAPYTARKEKSDYWYGYRKVSGKLHKRYIGKSVEVTQEKLEAIGEALNVAPEPKTPRVTQSVTDRVTDTVTQIVAVTDTVTQDKIKALEERLQELEERLGKLRA